MQIIKKYNSTTIFILYIVIVLYNNIPSFAQEANQTQVYGEEEYANKPNIQRR